MNETRNNVNERCPYCRHGVKHDHYVLIIDREHRPGAAPERPPTFIWPEVLPFRALALPRHVNRKLAGWIDDLLTTIGIDEPFYVETRVLAGKRENNY